jgi:hypothetical protein
MLVEKYTWQCMFSEASLADSGRLTKRIAVLDDNLNAAGLSPEGSLDGRVHDKRS